MIGGSTRLLGLMGHPVGHSLSPRMHNASFSVEGMDYVYVAMDVRPEDLPAAVTGASALGFRGFNLTMPHKRAILPLLESIDEVAAVSEAVNTVVIEDKRSRGYNTDGSGLTEACRESGVDFANRRVLLLGAGGAAAAIALALVDEGAKELRIVNRNAEHARELLSKLRKTGKEIEGKAFPFEALDEAASETEIIVNVTPLGMKEEDPLPVPVEYLDGREAICDAVYSPYKETALVQRARERGVVVVAGKRMLLYQGVYAQRLWTGREPNVKAMDDALS
jgi:shikimate dehydrogenase